MLKKFKTRLYYGHCSFRFFGSATSKHFHHYIPPFLNETDLITDTVLLHMGTNDIINSEVKKDLVADSIINSTMWCF